MAPRGGGGRSSGGGSSSSSGSSSDDSSESNVWLQKGPLSGSGWTEPAIVASVVFAGLFFLTLIGIRIWFGRAKKQHWSSPVWKAVMGKRWDVALSFGLLYYCWRFIEQVLHEEQVSVANCYLIVEFILLSVVDIAEIALLYVIYTLLHQCFLHPNGTSDSKAKMKKNIFLAHTTLCGLLGVLYLAYLALGIRNIVDLVQNYGDPLFGSLRSSRSLRDYLKIDAAFEIIYFLASVEILAASIYLLVTKSKRGLSGKAVGGFVGLVAVPLFIRKTWTVSFTIRYELLLLDVSLPVATAEIFIVGAAWMVVYGGVIFVVAALTTIGQNPGGAAGFQPNPQAPPMMTQQPGVPPQGQQQYYVQQPYPQQQQYGAPQQQYGQEIKAFNAGSPPPQGFSPPPQQNGMPPQGFYPPRQQNGVPPQGFMHQQQHYPPPPQQQYSPPPQQHTQSPVSSASPQPTAGAHSHQSSELPSTHY